MKSYIYLKPQVLRVESVGDVDAERVSVRDDSGCLRIVNKSQLKPRQDLVMQQVWDETCADIAAVTKATSLFFAYLPPLTWVTTAKGQRQAQSSTGTYTCLADDRHWHITYADKNHARARAQIIYDGASLSDGFKHAELHHCVCHGCIKL